MTAKSDFSDNTNLIRRYKNGNREALGEITALNMKLVISIARRFTSRGYELEDLIQTGTIGLLKAVEGFDEGLGYSFSTYAFPFIAGEIKRFIRDDGPIKVSRKTKSNALKIINAGNEFTKEHLRDPKISELVLITGLTQEEVCEAIEVSRPTLSLQDKISSEKSDMTIEDTVSDVSTIDMLTERIALCQEISSLPEDERAIIQFRFFRNLTQAQVAKILGVSQVTVSRSEKKIIDKLRQKIL
jgi:RNA polymerase sporulation-specific sigma factor